MSTQNTLPIYAYASHIDSQQDNNSGTIVGLNPETAQDGTGSNLYQIFQAGTNGSYIDEISFKAVSGPGTTVGRIYLCNNTSGSFTAGTTNTATNTMLIGEIDLQINGLSQTSASTDNEFVMSYAIPASWRILVAFGTSTGGGSTIGYSIVVWATDY